MTFKYSCFISYCRGQGELMEGFVEALKKALKSYLEPFLDEEVYIDKEHLVPGAAYNEELARAICQSVCMIVVYVPKYERHAYCRREYRAMEILEEKRLAKIGRRKISNQRSIIPFVLRGADDLPPQIKDEIEYLDFSRYTTASVELSRNPEYVDRIDRIAKSIHELYKVLSAASECTDCEEFALPPESEAQPWRAAAPPPFPTRDPTK